MLSARLGWNPIYPCAWAHVGVDSSPLVDARGYIYVGADDGYVYALEPAQGNKLWQVPTGGAVTSSPALSSYGTLLVGSNDGYMYALSGAGAGPPAPGARRSLLQILRERRAAGEDMTSAPLEQLGGYPG